MEIEAINWLSLCLNLYVVDSKSSDQVNKTGDDETGIEYGISCIRFLLL